MCEVFSPLRGVQETHQNVLLLHIEEERNASSVFYYRINKQKMTQTKRSFETILLGEKTNLIGLL